MFRRYNIDNSIKGCMLLANLAEESAGFSRFTENLNYSAIRLRQVFPKYFTTDKIALEYGGKPQLIANRVYANRLGNSNEESGDGWKYRGRGVIQITGKNNYIQMSKLLNFDFVNNPNKLSETPYSLYCAGAFWNLNNISNIIISNTEECFKKVVKKINGGLTNYSSRKSYWEKAKKIFY